MGQQLQDEQNRLQSPAEAKQESKLPDDKGPSLPVKPTLRSKIVPETEKTVVNEIFAQQVDPETILQGMIWSEIIGPPRCRRKGWR